MGSAQPKTRGRTARSACGRPHRPQAPRLRRCPSPPRQPARPAQTRARRGPEAPAPLLARWRTAACAAARLKEAAALRPCGSGQWRDAAHAPSASCGAAAASTPSMYAIRRCSCRGLQPRAAASSSCTPPTPSMPPAPAQEQRVRSECDALSQSRWRARRCSQPQARMATRAAARSAHTSACHTPVERLRLVAGCSVRDRCVLGRAQSRRSRRHLQPERLREARAR